jgi:hypothetical protein
MLVALGLLTNAFCCESQTVMLPGSLKGESMHSFSIFGTALLWALLVGINTNAATTTPHRHVIRNMPHLDLEMTGFEYRNFLRSQKQQKSSVFKEVETAKDPETIALEVYVKFGERNLEWLELLNKNRVEGQKLSLTSEATANGNSVNNPRILNLAEVDNQWFVLRTLMPDALKKVIFDGEPMPTSLPVTEREYIEWCRQVDNAYQNSARILTLNPWKDELKQTAIYDVRGFLKLRDDATIDTKLSTWMQLPELQRIALSAALVMICKNSETAEETCRTELATAVSENNVLEFKNKYWAPAQDLYNSFFAIPKSRPDVTWTAAQPNLFSIPFANPNNDAVLDFLRLNIEDEFNWQGWQLRLDFVPTEDLNTTHIVFEAGSTPHVNDLAGSEITMDANAPLSEYDVQWTIRHEYGHVLGFPDCYFEFYDETLAAYVSYQLDITNLMCSRRGHLQQRHFDELKRVYFK